MNPRNQQYFAAAFSLAFVAGAARAQSEASMLDDVSTLPVASVAADSMPTAGATFVVKGVEATAYTTAYTLERLSDRARIRVEIAGRGAKRSPVVAGTVVTAAAASTGTVLRTGDGAIAFIPNALGRALLRDGRLAA